MAVVAMMVGSIVALLSTLILHMALGLSLGQAVTVYFGSGLMTMLLAATIARMSFMPSKTASAFK